jgi:hypothetical protein
MLIVGVRRRAVIAVVIAGLVAGCGSTGGPPPAASPDSTVTASIPDRSDPPASLAPSPAPPSPTPGPSVILLPLGGGSPGPAATVTIDDPDLTLLLPPAWLPLSVSAVRAEVEHVMAVATPAMRASYAGLIGMIDAGEIRGGGIGPSGFEPWQGTIVYAVSPAASIDAEIARVESLQLADGKPTTRERSDVRLAVGHAVRIEVTVDPPKGAAAGSVAARGIEYFVDLGHGRIFWLTATGPAASATFADLIDGTLASLARR